MADTKIQSLLRGRIGASVLAVVSTLCILFGVSPEDTQTATVMTNQVMTWIGAGSGIGSAVLAFYSKLRENK